MDLTQAQVAEKIGTSQSAVARMESGSGKHSPSLATLSKYADALGASWRFGWFAGFDQLKIYRLVQAGQRRNALRLDFDVYELSKCLVAKADPALIQSKRKLIAHRNRRMV